MSTDELDRGKLAGGRPPDDHLTTAHDMTMLGATDDVQLPPPPDPNESIVVDDVVHVDEPATAVKDSQKKRAPPDDKTFASKEYFEASAGIVYLFVSLGCGIWYCFNLAPSLSNDLWWAGYNLTGYSAFLIDVTNLALTTTKAGSLDIQAPAMTLQKNYTAAMSSTLVYPTYVRRLIMNEHTGLARSITALRGLTGKWSMRMNTQHCWVDFGQVFQVAHTPQRQARCAARYATNAAVYMEATLRNVVWAEFIQVWGGPGSAWEVSVQAALEEKPAGVAWLAATSTARALTTEAQELAYWQSHALATFTQQYQNRWQASITETFVVKNALGMEQELTIKNVPRGAGPWTTVQFFWIPLNDLWSYEGYGRSLVVGASTDFRAPPACCNIELDNGLSDSSGNFPGQSGVLRTALGMYFTTDLFLVAQPAPLQALYAAFQASLFGQLQANDALWTAYNALATTAAVVYPVPPAWRATANDTIQFLGGS
ncbi:hypothetical protein As57867_018027, partial [Aphanomyces stellatus]